MGEMNPAYYQPQFFERVYQACPHIDLVFHKHLMNANVKDPSFVNFVLGAILREHYEVFLNHVTLPVTEGESAMRRQLHDEWTSGSCYTREGVEAFYCPRHVAEKTNVVSLLLTADRFLCGGREYDTDYYLLCPRWQQKEECWSKWRALTGGQSK